MSVKEEYVAVSAIKHGRAVEGDVIEWEPEEEVDPQYFTEEQFNKLISLGAVIPRPVSQRAQKLEDELAAKEAELVELRSQLAAQERAAQAAQEQAVADAASQVRTSHAPTVQGELRTPPAAPTATKVESTKDNS
jgi:hypothetical protein